MNRISLWICIFNAIAAFGRDKVPTHEHVTDRASVKQYFIGEENLGGRALANRYARTIQSQRVSLVTVIDRGEAFHLDALAFTLKTMTEALQTTTRSASGTGGDRDGDLSFGDYEILIQLLSQPKSPGINLTLISPGTL